MSCCSPGAKAHRHQQFWRLVEGEALRWRCWEGEYVVFNPLSGQTHVLDIVRGEILSLLLAGSRNATEMGSRISKFLEVEDDERLASTISELLVSLEDAGLVERLDRVCE